MYRRGVVLLLALALAGCSAGAGGGADGVSTVFPVAQRSSAPKIEGELLDGTKYGFSTGKVTVLNFWASWCGPCRAETDDLEVVRTAQPGVDFLGVDIRDDRDKAKSFVAGKASYPSLFDPAGKIALGFRDVPPNTIPATFILDRHGRIAVVIRKPIQREDLTALLAPVVAES